MGLVKTWVCQKQKLPSPDYLSRSLLSGIHSLLVCAFAWVSQRPDSFLESYTSTNSVFPHIVILLKCVFTLACPCGTRVIDFNTELVSSTEVQLSQALFLDFLHSRSSLWEVLGVSKLGHGYSYVYPAFDPVWFSSNYCCRFWKALRQSLWASSLSLV